MPSEAPGVPKTPQAAPSPDAPGGAQRELGPRVRTTVHCMGRWGPGRGFHDQLRGTMKPWVPGLLHSHGASDAAAAVFGVTEEAPSDPCAAASSLR